MADPGGVSGSSGSIAPPAQTTPLLLPSFFMNTTTTSSTPEEENEEILDLLLKELTLEEKLRLLSGQSLWTLAEVSRLDLPSLTVSDGPHGVRKPVKELSFHESYPATCFPTACSLACSWDPLLLHQVGIALRDECLHYKISILLGPGMNLKRHGGGGRNFEYFSEDPLLSSRLAAAYVKGVQTPLGPFQVGACIKHYTVNNQESHRFVVNAVVDERTCHELYYRNFLTAIQASQPATVMCAYNRLNGEYCSEHSQLYQWLRPQPTQQQSQGQQQTTYKKNCINYNGVIMTDWGATNQRSKAISVGLDLEMPGSHGAHDRALCQALMLASNSNATANTTTTTNNPMEEEEDQKRISLSQEAVDASCRRLLRLIRNHQAVLDYGVVDDKEEAEMVTSIRHNDNNAAENGIMYGEVVPLDFGKQHEIAYRAAMQCIVLLKNDPMGDGDGTNTTTKSLLPLSPAVSLAVIGDFARHARFQGMGSSQVNASKLSCLLEELQRYTQKIDFARGYDPDDDNTTHIQQDLVDEAVSVVQDSGAEVVLLCVGLPEILESEGFDRTTLQLPAQHNALIRDITAVHNKVVLLLSNGGVVELCDESMHSAAILEGYLLGQAGAAATADILFGVESPSGKLAETMPLRMQDILADAFFPGTRDVVEHREGLDVGYRYFDTDNNKTVRFPFGHGLSYTPFEYGNLQVQVVKDDEKEALVTVSFDVQNTGSIEGREVAQCYVHDPVCSVYRPVHELRDFTKISLEPGETKTVTFHLRRDSFAFYDIGVSDWVVEEGAFDVQIGSSSRDIRLRSTVHLASGNHVSQLARDAYPPVLGGGTLTVIDDETFAKRFGKDKERVLLEIQGRQYDQSIQANQRFHRNSLLKEVAATRILGQLLMHIVFTEASKEVKPGPLEKRQLKMVQANVENLPLRTLVIFSKGGLSFEGLDTFIAMMNRDYCQAMKTSMKALSAAVSNTVSGLIGK